MKLMLRLPLFHLLLCCATQVLGVTIESEVSSDGVIWTELEKAVSLVCQPDSSLQADEELVWLRNGAAISLKEGNKKGRSTVCVTPVTTEDNDATFTCHLRKNATDSASVTLNVTYHPQLSGSEDVIVEEDAVLHLQCNIWANPPVSSVSWKLNGSRVDLEAGGFTVFSNGFTTQLSANAAEKSLHEGTYQCMADSPMYGQFTKNFNVQITGKIIMFPLYPMIAGLVVVFLTAFLAIISRWNKITKCCK